MEGYISRYLCTRDARASILYVPLMYYLCKHSIPFDGFQYSWHSGRAFLFLL